MNVMLLNVPGELQTPDLSARFLRCCEERQLGGVELSFGFVGIHVPPVVAIATRDLEGDYRLAYELSSDLGEIVRFLRRASRG